MPGFALVLVLPTVVVAWAPAAVFPARPQPFAASARLAVGIPSRARQHVLVSLAGAAPPVAPFNQTKAVLAAGFAFEAYNEPSEQDARWERGADGCDVAFMSEDFAREATAHLLVSTPATTTQRSPTPTTASTSHIGTLPPT